MATNIAGQVGPTAVADGSKGVEFRQARTADMVISEGHGRFWEPCSRNTLYGFGISNTTLSTTTAIATGVTATATPIIGLWNPPSSPVNLVVLQATIVVTTIGATAVAPGGFMWLVSSGQNNITTGSTPINAKTLVAGGSVAKVFSVSTALTGLVGGLVTYRVAAITCMNAAGAATAVSLVQGQITDNVDGAIIVPPGGVLAMMNQVSTTTNSVSTSILWEEVVI